jgi:hypothetical protein
MFRLKTALLPVALTLFLCCAMPAPAHAQLDLLSSLNSFFSVIATGITKLLGITADVGKTVSAANAQTGKALAKVMGNVADANATNTDNSIKNLAGANVTTQVEAPGDISCQIATNNKDEFLRKTQQDQVVLQLSSALDHAFITPSAGQLIGMNKIIKALCSLGATGKGKSECTYEEPNATLRELIEGSDWDISKMLVNQCIPFDGAKFAAELKKLAGLPDDGTYTLSDPNLKQAMVYFLAIRVNRKLSIDSIPTPEQSKTVSGRTNAARHREMVSQVLASI